MKHFLYALLLPALLIGLIACSGGKDAQRPDEDTASAQEQAPRCDSDQAQRTLTYCASPGVATYARQNAAILEAMQKGEVSREMFPLPVGDSPVMGPASAPVTVMMFSDLECPFCARAHQRMAALQRAFPEHVRLVYKHFPLSIHPNAEPAARAAQAAAAQGKFWEFVELAYERQDQLSEELYAELIAEVGGDPSAFAEAMRQTGPAEHVQEDMALGDHLNVAGTPTIFFNGVPIPGDVTLDQLGPVIEQQVNIAEAYRQAGVPADQVYWRLVRSQYQPLPERGPAADRDPQEQAPAFVHVPVGASPVQGAAVDDALVTVVVFSDFQCPFCQRVVAPLEQALEAHGDSVRVAFKHFPLPFHDRADNAAGLAILAQRAGKFWPMHDVLFANQDDLSDEALVRYAEQVGLPTDDLPGAIDDPSIEAVIERDMTLGIEAGVNGTPALFINGEMHAGAMSAEQLDALLVTEIARGQRVKDATGLRGAPLYEAIVEQRAPPPIEAAADLEAP